MIEKHGYVLSKGFEKLKDNLIHSIANPLFIKDINHTWIMVNQSFCDILNVTSEDLLGKSDYDIFPQKEADVFWEKDDDVFKTGKTNINEEELTNIKGEKFTILTSKVRIEDEDGNYYILGTITDISEMKFDEIQLEKKNLLINAQKNEIKNAISDLQFNNEQNLHVINDIICALSCKKDASLSIESIEKLKNWLGSMILVHQFISETFNIKKITLLEYLNQLSGSIPNIKSRINLIISGDVVVLAMRYMAPIGIIITEILRTSKVDGKVNAVRIHITYESDNLEIEVNTDYELISINDAKGIDFGLSDLLKTLVNHLNGSIDYSVDRTTVRININNISVIARGSLN